MQINNPVDKILGSELKVKIVRFFCQGSCVEASGREIARMAGVTPKAAHEALQDLLLQGALRMRAVGRTYLFFLNQDRFIIKNVLRPLFEAEGCLVDDLLDFIQGQIKKSGLKKDILSVVLFGSVQLKTDRMYSDVDLMVITKTAQIKKKVEDFFYEIDQQLSSQWGNLISPYVNSLNEFKTKQREKSSIINNIMRSYRLIYGVRLERLLR